MRQTTTFLIAATIIITTFSNRAEAERRRGGLRVQINSTPPGAAIHIDDEPRGTTPSWVDLPRGTHQLRLGLDGHAPLEQELSVTRAWARFNFDLVALGRIEIRARDDTANGAAVTIDGEAVGSIPLTHELIPGRHSYTVSREGFHDETRWFEIAGGQTYSTDLSLRPVPPPTGEILVVSDVTGAAVFLDSSPAGTTPTIVETAPGEHSVEVRSEGFESQSQTTTVESGGRVTVNITLRPERPPGGTLLVLTEPEAARVFIDGQEHGTSPATVGELLVGTHIVEARAEGYESATERVEVEVGRQATVRLALEEIPRGAGLRVACTVEGAEVLLDGRAIGQTPLTERNIEPGEHLIVVRAQGHNEWERRLMLESGVELMLEVDLGAMGRLNISANVEGAEIIIDGVVAGTSPLNDHEISTGDHTIEIRAEGRAPFSTTVTVDAGATNTVTAQLQSETAEGGAGPSQAERPAPDRSGHRFNRSGFPPPPFVLSFDAGWGWPYLIGWYRLGLGVWDGLDWARIDIGLEVRSSFWVTEIDARLRFGTRFARIMRVGLELGLGGSVGRSFDSTNENRAGFIMNLLLTEGFEVGPVAFGLTQRMEFYIDTHGETGMTGLVRQVGARVFVGGFVEARVHRMVHVYVLADYAPGQKARRILCASSWDPVANECSHSWMRDINLAVQAGVGFRFF